MKVSEIFSEAPTVWGLRGDPAFWEHLKTVFSDKKLPYQEEQLEQVILAELEKITNGKPLEAKHYVEKYDSGGMSGGVISGKWWIETAIPLLKDRLKHLSKCFFYPIAEDY